MFSRALPLLILAAAVLAKETSPKFHMTPDGPAPHPTVRVVNITATDQSATANSTFMDTVQEDLKILKDKADEMRVKLDVWLEDDFHRNVLFPACIGAASGIITIWFYFLCRCLCRKCGQKKGYSRLDKKEPLPSTSRAHLH